MLTPQNQFPISVPNISVVPLVTLEVRQHLIQEDIVGPGLLLRDGVSSPDRLNRLAPLAAPEAVLGVAPLHRRRGHDGTAAATAGAGATLPPQLLQLLLLLAFLDDLAAGRDQLVVDEAADGLGRALKDNLKQELLNVALRNYSFFVYIPLIGRWAERRGR